MRTKLKFLLSLSVLAGFLFLFNGCSSVPKGAARTAQITAGQLQISGAGIVRADAETVTFRIKCKRCGFESEPITILTPQADKPYVLNWTCPNCGHKQTITIKLV